MKNYFISQSNFNTAVLFIAFNRPDTSARVFEAIRNAKPPRLYVVVDGPRQNQKGEIDKVAKVHKIIRTINWPCKLRTLFRKNNLGCKESVSRAITWFFEQEQEGIILEDDCLPHPDFFVYCQNLLNYYREDNRVWTISGSSFQSDRKEDINSSYYFSKYFDPWGWAAWRRTWKFYDSEIKFWPKWKDSIDWKNKLKDKAEQNYWKKIFDLIYAKKIDTWDYSFIASILKNDGLTAIPNRNLISNIGFRKDATHTTNKKNRFSNRPIEELGMLVHPKKIEQDEVKDRNMFDYRFEGRNFRMPWLFLSLPVRIAKYIFRRLNLRLS
jgi:hypothetical protein